ncbi:hypothetical protein KTN05_07755 [Paracoccus sp. Z118]|uniref:hypothetical protein n=1 Tax=Paracoccus sp. Z118 TaxID=2851017 RepID=UPI001C2BAE89|nr:hypothetical protein [Paracoccus sp. Z118]MBV0891743.1 hypothetical protein [Paracoccus sp. Z118]
MEGSFTSAGLRGGIWQGILHSGTPPQRVFLAQTGMHVAGASVEPAGEGRFHVSVALPVDRLSDGVHSFVLLADDGEADESPRPGAARLGVLPLIAGRPLDDDLRAEIELMRAELDLLKRELRRLASA